jgi:hypothetical protein
LDDDIEI